MQLKAQSAMEYLMTYGWAILIIAVVLGALFQLGVFNPNSFAPKARPGSCQVIRPYGTGNTNYISLAGTCNNQLPQYVAKFNGASSYINVGNPTALDFGANTAFALSVWAEASPNSHQQTIFDKRTATTSWYRLSLGSNGQIYLELGGNYPTNYAAASSTAAYNDGNWHYIVATRDTSGTVDLYIDGKSVNSISNAAFSLSNPYDVFIGASNALVAQTSFAGQMANMQAYNTSLSANDVTALYNEGIGGAPIDLFHLIGWWPLNGNANDYSGNLDNGAEANILYSSSWTSSYAVP